MSPCPPIDDLSWRLLEGDLDEVAEEELALHLERCPGCREALKTTVRTHRVLIAQGMDGALSAPRTAPTRRHPHPPTVVRGRIHPPPRRLPAPLLWGGLLAAAALVVALVLDHEGARPEPPPPQAQEAPVLAPAFARLLAAAGVQVSGYGVDAGTVLIPGSAVVVARTGQARIALADGTVIAASADTRFQLLQHATRRDGGRAGVRIDLDQGVLAAQVQPQDVQAPLVFRTPLAEVVVVGTELTVRHVPGSASELAVASGKVQWTPLNGVARLVPAGQHARIGAEVSGDATLRLDSLVGVEHQDRELSSWKDVRGKGLAAHGVDKECRPLLVTSNGRQTVGFSGRHRRLAVDLGCGFNPAHGLTVLVVMEPQGACKDEHIVTLVGDGVPQLALLRSGLPACLRVEGGGRTSEPSQALGQGIWSLACRVEADGRVELLRGTSRLVSGHVAITAARHAILFLGGDAQEASLSALLYAVELYPRPLSDAEVAERFGAIARLHALGE